MRYENFIDGMRLREGEHWDIIKRYSLIVGGLNFAGDFL